MQVELTKEDLVNLVSGTQPNYNTMDIALVKRCGYYSGGFNDSWHWNNLELDKLTERQLFDLYKICKR